MTNDKTTNDTLLCMVSPHYALNFCSKVALQDIEMNQTGNVLMHVIEWYRKNYRHAGEWFLYGLRSPSNAEIIAGIDPRLEDHAKELIAFKDSNEGKQRLLASVGL